MIRFVCALALAIALIPHGSAAADPAVMPTPSAKASAGSKFSPEIKLVKRFVALMNAGDSQGVVRLFDSDPSITDTLLPLSSSGRGASARWVKAWESWRKPKTTGALKIWAINSKVVNSTANSAYVVTAASWAYKTDPAHIGELTILTFDLRKDGDGWHIKSFTSTKSGLDQWKGLYPY